MPHNSKKILKIIKARLHIAPYMPKPKCVSGTICMKWNYLHSYKPAVDDLWHPLSPAHGLPRISASENIFIFIQDQGAPPSPNRSIY